MDTSPRIPAARRSLAALLAVLLATLWSMSPEPASAQAVPGFQDVSTSSPHAAAIKLLVQAGISTGCASDRYCPDDPLTRAQMASLLARTFDLPPSTSIRFVDVPSTSTHLQSISALATAGVTRGCSSARFCPNDQVTREQAASLLARILKLQPSGRHAGFTDLQGSIHSRSIMALADAGITSGCAPDRFCGKTPITRAQFASLFVQGAKTEIYLAAARKKDQPGSAVRISPQEPAPSGTTEPAPSGTTEPAPSGTTEPAPSGTTEPAPSGTTRLLYSDADVVRYVSSMAKPGPYYATGDAGHGGAYSPGDGARSVQLARDFLANPKASYWIQTDLPYSSGDAWPNNMVYVRPMHAAWVVMTQPNDPNRDALRREVKALLLHHATHSSHDFSNATNYPINYPGFAPSPIFAHAQWMTRLIKARDMLGRETFTATENATLDRWFYDYANWTFKWLHHEMYVKKLPGREARDYSRINMPADASRSSYDGGPKIGSLAMAYTNRQASNASAASLAANYLKFHGYIAPTSGGPAYGRFTIDQLLLHSRLFVEETIRFSVYPQGLQGDFERGDRNRYSNASAQLGWEYSANVLASLVEMTEYHAKRGDLSLWNYGTTAGYDGTAGVPVAGGFTQKSVHFYAWSMSRYVNDGWNRRNFGEPLALPSFYRDVIPAATIARFAPTDTLLRDAWRRQGSNFPPYPQKPASQGIWDARYGEGAKLIGLIEHANGSTLR
jgi:hypothetical protein